MDRDSERSSAHHKPRFPRLTFLRQRRKVIDFLNSEHDRPARPGSWYCTADPEGMVQVRPR